MEAEIKNLLEEIILVSDESILSNMISKLKELKESLKDSPNCLIKNSIIDIFPEDNKEIKTCFKIILLTQSKELIIEYIRSIFNIKINEIENEICNLNLNNHFSITYIHELLKIFIDAKKENIKKINYIDEINEKIKNIQIFRCSKCFDLLYVYHTEEGTTLTCNNSSHTIENSLTLKDLNKYNLICYECKKVIKIYYDNYKCLKCKNFICKICKEKHISDCLLSILINLYEVGYICEKHNKKYIDSCDLCNKNLCEDCKSNHFHIIKPEFHLQLQDISLELVNTDKLKKTKNYIKYYLIKKFLYMKRFNLINVKIIKSLHCIINKEKYEFKVSGFYSAIFYDKEFKQYYNNIIEDAKKGKINEYNVLKSLETEYKKVNLYHENNEYDEFIDLCLSNQRKRNDNLNNIYSIILNSILLIEKTFDNSKIFCIKKHFEESDTNVILLKNKIKKLKTSNQIRQFFIKKLLTRYFADYIIKMLIKKYYKKFKPIKLSLINIYEIINQYGIDIISDTEKDIINTLIEDLLCEEDITKRDQYLINYFNNIKLFLLIQLI